MAVRAMNAVRAMENAVRAMENAVRAMKMQELSTMQSLSTMQCALWKMHILTEN